MPTRPILRLQLPHRSGSEVLELQQALGAHGYTLAADGVFGHGLDKAVRHFQKSENLEVDGIVDAKVWAALLSDK